MGSVSVALMAREIKTKLYQAKDYYYKEFPKTPEAQGLIRGWGWRAQQAFYALYSRNKSVWCTALFAAIGRADVTQNYRNRPCYTTAVYEIEASQAALNLPAPPYTPTLGERAERIQAFLAVDIWGSYYLYIKERELKEEKELYEKLLAGEISWAEYYLRLEKIRQKG